MTEICVVDEMAGAAELAKGKSSGIPVVIVRGADRSWFRESSVRAEVVRPHVRGPVPLTSGSEALGAVTVTGDE